jgi:hypothetical protein
MVKSNLKTFIERSKLIHGNKYDYSLVEYVNNQTKIKIICPEHGEFLKTPVKHINSKQGCPNCSTIKSNEIQKKGVKKFIQESKLIHGDKYNYSLVEYINNRVPVKIICPKHGIFEQTPSNNLRGKGCIYCGGTAKLDTNLFIYKAKLIHGDKYDYSLVNYINSQTKIKIICPEHGEFEQLPNNHLSKEQGCYKCLGNIFDTDSFIKISSKIHNNKYDYSLVNYININSNVNIICPEHGLFSQRCDSHRHGSGCPKCSNSGISKQEIEINDFILSLNIKTNVKDRTTLNGKELDIYIPSHNIAIEYNGLYWHSEEFVEKNYHLNKTNKCESNNIQLIHIFEDEWLYKQDIVKSRLKNILGLTKDKIYGRKCDIKEVSSKESKEFLNNNHIQGSVNSSIRLGLYYNDELVSLMTFGKRPLINNHSIELIRFCNKLDTSVIGGADKLLKHFIKTYNPKEIISYADRRWSTGDLYEKLGFKFIHNTPPNFYYVINKKRINRLNFQKHKLVKMGYDKNKTANQIMIDENINKIYDCGNKKYIKH